MLLIKKIKKLAICGAVAFCMAMTATVSAVAPALAIPVKADDEVFNNRYFASDRLPDEVDKNSLYRDLRSALMGCNRTVDISSYGIPSVSAHDILEFISYSIPESFHLDSISYDASPDGNIARLYFSYICSLDEYESKLAECEAAADRLTADLVGANELSDAEKALIIHDRIATICEYDYAGYLDYIQHDTPLARDDYNICGALINGRAVCEGYALANIYLLSRLGIQSVFCLSSQMRHGWNIVWIDDVPYHVDITWDDTVWDVDGKVEHQYFLLSSAELESRRTENGVSEVDYDTTPADERYDDYYWQDSNTAFQYVGGKLYYFDNDDNNLVCVTDGFRVIDNIDSRWNAGEMSYWSDNFSRLASYGTKLYYSSADSIYSYDTADGKISVFYKPDLSGYSYFAIYGLAVSGTSLIYDIFNSPNFDSTTKQYYQFRIPVVSDPIEEEKLAGDINGDGNVNTTDMVRLMKYISGSSVTVFVPDVNGDGSIGVADVVRLMKYIAGYNVKLVASDPRG